MDPTLFFSGGNAEAIRSLRVLVPWSDRAVFQRNRPISVRGSGTPGMGISARLGGHEAAASIADDGTWDLNFPPMAAGGPHRLEVRAANGETFSAGDLLAGDVWYCSGQSNMEWPVKDAAADPDSLRSLPHVRYFSEGSPAWHPQDDLPGRWRGSDEATKCSAVAWSFGQRLHNETGVPIGLIVTAVGGTEIAAWMPRASLEALPGAEAIRARIGPDRVAGQRPGPYVDAGIAEKALSWHAPGHEPEAWQPFGKARLWQGPGLDFNGAVWFRTTLRIPEGWAARQCVLSLAVISDYDRTWVNGHLVGGIGPENPNAYLTPRLYFVPGAAVQAAEMTVTVRIFDQWGAGGLCGPAGAMWVAPQDAPHEAISLADGWEYRVELPLKRRSPVDGIMPTSLFNSRVSPLRHTPVRGVIWYQGESDASRASLYRRLLPELIRAWREMWNDPALPFYLVQLASYKPLQTQPVEDDWAELRDAQLQTALNTPNTGLAVAIDVGEADDIHPRRKRPVGERLARWALRHEYGRADIVPSGPLFAGSEIEDGCIRVRFRFAEGLQAGGADPVGGFAIAGADRKFVWANAVLDGETVVVSSPHIAHPAAVRYAWHANPLGATLANGAGLPASPFRTDDWPLSTEPRV